MSEAGACPQDHYCIQIYGSRERSVQKPPLKPVLHTFITQRTCLCAQLIPIMLTAKLKDRLVHTVHHRAKGTEFPRAQPQAPANEPCNGLLLNSFFCLLGRSQLEQHFQHLGVTENLGGSEEAGAWHIKGGEDVQEEDNHTRAREPTRADSLGLVDGPLEFLLQLPHAAHGRVVPGRRLLVHQLAPRLGLLCLHDLQNTAGVSLARQSLDGLFPVPFLIILFEETVDRLRLN